MHITHRITGRRMNVPTVVGQRMVAQNMARPYSRRDLAAELPTPPPLELAAEKPKRKRAYKRRDMQAEG
jgi:hypothetical protein